MNPDLAWQKLWAAIACIGVLILVVGSLMSMSNVEVKVSDKTLHVVAYALLGTWFVLIFVGRKRWFALASLFALGIVLEIVQGQVGRTTDVNDALANAAGVCVAVLIGFTPLQHALRWFEGWFR